MLIHFAESVILRLILEKEIEMKTLKEKIRAIDIYTVLIVALVVVSTGHVGQLFASRESEAARALGYVMAVALDGVLVVSLHQATQTTSWRKVAPLSVFLLACAVSGGFNYQYYIQNYPLDPRWVSASLGATPPVLAALMAALRALRTTVAEEADWKREETERQATQAHELTLEKARLEAETKVKIAVGTAKEQTKQANAAVRLARIEESKQKDKEIEAKQTETRRQAIESLGVYRATYDYFMENPRADRETAAQALDVTTRTVGNHLKHLESAGIIKHNGSGVSILLEAN